MARRRGVWAELQHERALRKKAAEKARRAAAQQALQAQRMHKQQLRLRGREAAATERERKRLYVEDRRAEAADLTAAVVEQVAELESVLRDGLSHAPDVSFEGLKLEFEAPPFDAGGLDQPLPAPEWEPPTPPSLLGSSRRRRCAAPPRARCEATGT